MRRGVFQPTGAGPGLLAIPFRNTEDRLNAYHAGIPHGERGVARRLEAQGNLRLALATPLINLANLSP